MTLSRRSALLLVVGGLFQWGVWPTFLKNVWADPRSFRDGPTAFLLVHAALTVLSLALGAALLVLGTRGLRRR